MDYVEGVKDKGLSEIKDVQQGKCDRENVTMNGMVYKIRDMADFAFIILRKRTGIVQCIYNYAANSLPISEIPEESSVQIRGSVRDDERAPGGFEIDIKEIKVLSKPAATMPVAVNKWKLNVGLDSELQLRPVILRNEKKRAVFKLQEGLVRGFRDFLFTQGFTEIRSPKIVAAGAEGGANIFKLDYFGKKAFLAQSPQFYKQIMVPVYERVFEVSPVFRAEKHNTTRHLNEYMSMDFEMGFIDGFEDIMDMEAAMLRYTFHLLETEYADYLKKAGVTLPRLPEKVPAVKFADAKKMASEKYGRPIKNPYDLDPEEEVLIGKLFQEDFNSDFVFVTHYPSKKRPFYAMDDPEDPTYTLSFDLLFDGMEITTGGQRIHDYNEQVAKMEKRGMHPELFESYLMAHKHGMPPHGGLGIGLERLLMRLIGENNVRYTSLFPRDQIRLDP